MRTQLTLKRKRKWQAGVLWLHGERYCGRANWSCACHPWLSNPKPSVHASKANQSSCKECYCEESDRSPLTVTRKFPSITGRRCGTREGAHNAHSIDTSPLYYQSSTWRAHSAGPRVAGDAQIYIPLPFAYTCNGQSHMRQGRQVIMWGTRGVRARSVPSLTIGNDSWTHQSIPSRVFGLQIKLSRPMASLRTQGAHSCLHPAKKYYY